MWKIWNQAGGHMSAAPLWGSGPGAPVDRRRRGPQGGTEESAGYHGAGRSPAAIGGAVMVHALVAAMVLLMPREMITPYIPQIMIGRQIPLDPPPPPNQTEPAGKTNTPQTKQHIGRPRATIDPLVPLKPIEGGPAFEGGLGGAAGSGSATIQRPIEPPNEPVLVDAVIDPRALPAFQPNYPGSMIRQGLEGSVKVRVEIGVNGRVSAIERLSATDEAFWIATERHALRKWRFRPATRDGTAVASSRILTVHFRLTDR